MLSEYLLPSDARFFSQYAKPLVSAHSELFDLDEFEIPNCLTLTDFNEAFMKFKNDSSAQYEMHPKFGRYVWDISDQWYQKWNVVLSMENMWSWTYNRSHLLPDMHTLASLQPWLDSITFRHHIHPDHRLLLENICMHLFKWQKSNKILTDAGTFCLNTIPFFPPSWFTEKKMQSHVEEGDLLAPSYFAKFVPPYRLDDYVPERWDVVFLKGINYDPTNEKFDIDPNLIVSIIPLYGLTVIFDETTGYSYLMMVMRKAAYGNLETNLQEVIPTDYHKPRRLALSITKAVKDLHWEYIHGNVHPRNILFNFDDTIGELVDATFVQPKHSVKSSTKSMNTNPSTTSNIITAPSTPPISPNESSSSLSKHLQFSPFINNNNNNNIEPLSSTSTSSSVTTATNTSLYHSQYSPSSSSTCIQQKKKRNGISGRWPYVAPEVAQGITGPSTEADIYALGVIIWQLISRVTFPPNAPLDPWIFRIEPIPGVLPEWESLYMDCLSPYPENRPSAYMVYRRLEKMNIYTTIPITQQQQSYHHTTVTASSSTLSLSSTLTSSSTSSITTCSAYNTSTHPLPIKQETLDYIHQRRKEIDEFMKEHKNQFSSPQQRLTKTKDNMILSASVTRSVNHGLENYPSLVHNMRRSSY